MKSVAKVTLTLTLLLPLAVSSILAAPEPAAAAKSPTLTIGEFAVVVAKSMDMAPETRATLSPEVALATLKDSGLRFSAGSDAVLTQAEFAAFMSQAGARISVPSPDLPVSPGQAKAAISGFGNLLASHGSGPKVTLRPATALSKPESGPEDFAQCAALDKVPDCKACCLALGQTQQTCGRACGQANAGHVSASEPTP